LVFSFVIKFLQKPYPYYIPFSRSFKLLLWFSIGFPIFYLIVQPFGVNNWQCDYKTIMLLGMAIPLFIGLTINFYGLSRVFPNFFKETRWTVGKEIIWSIWNIVTIVLLVNIYFRLLPVCGDGQHSSLTSTLVYGVLIGALPSFICVQFTQLQHMKRQLKKMANLNAILSQRVGIIDNQIVTLKGDNETLKIGMNDLLVIEAQDNYSKVIWFNGERVKTKLIRGTLKSMEDQLDLHFIKRCHRSYIANLSKVKSITGNSKAYKLNLEHMEMQIPVSRDLSKSLVKEIHELEIS
jgi:LytTr DNA-binding domain-containing protein